MGHMGLLVPGTALHLEESGVYLLVKMIETTLF